jgi:tetratricopeptide (TPR) repeat protein
MASPLTIHERHRLTCDCGHEMGVEVAAVVDCTARPELDDVPAAAPFARCSSCGHERELDFATLLYRGDDLVALVFIPAEHTPLDVDGQEAVRLVRALEQRLGRSPIGPARSLTVAPRRLARLVATRPLATDALDPAAVVVDDVSDEVADDYRRWLDAVRDDIGVSEIDRAVRDIAAAPTWTAVAEICEGSPNVTAAEASALVDAAFDRLAARTDERRRATLDQCRRFVSEVRQRGVSPHDVRIPGLEVGMPDTTPALQSAMDAYFATDPSELDERIEHLTAARRTWERSGGEAEHQTPVAIAAALATELYRRHRPEDLETAIELLRTTEPACVAAFGRNSRAHLRMRSDLAVCLMDRTVGDVGENSRSAREILTAIATEVDADADGAKEVLVDVWLNLGVAWLQAPEVTDRSAAQEEAITWLEQALGVEGLPDATEAMVCSNLGAAYRVRVIGETASNLERAREMHRRAVELTRRITAADADDRLVAALAMYATAAADDGDRDEAIGAFRESVTLAARTLPVNHPAVLRVQANLGSTLHAKYLATRSEDQETALGALHEARALLERTRDAMAASSPPHPMLDWVRASLAATLAEHVGDAGCLDAAGAEALFADLLDQLDPEADPLLLRTVGWNAGGFFLARGEPARAQEAYRAAWKAALALSGRALFQAAQESELRLLSRHAHRFAISACHVPDRKGDLDAAVVALDASRVRLLGGVAERARLAIDDPSTVEPRVRAAVADARSALDRQVIDERALHVAPPEERRRLARAARRRTEEALVLLDPYLPTSRDSSPASIPVVYIATTELASAVLIRYPDGTTIGFTADIRDEHLAELVAAADDPGGWAAGPALERVLPLVGTRLAEPLAAHLLGRGWQAAILVAGGPAAIVPFHAAPLRGHGTGHDGYLTDVVTLRAAPAQRLMRSQAISGRPSRPLAVVDDTLGFARWEIAASALFGSAEEARVRNRIDGADFSAQLAHVDWLHLSVHGGQAEHDPLRAHVALAGAELAVSDLIIEHRFRPGTVVVAPACRAGRAHPSNYDEGLSVGHAFLAAGAETVVAGLWDVPDPATALVVARFYTLLDHHGLWRQPEIALRSAQRWLRDVDRRALDAEIAEASSGDTWLPRALAERTAEWLAFNSEPRPFASPDAWAGLFTVSVRDDDADGSQVRP